MNASTRTHNNDSIELEAETSPGPHKYLMPQVPNKSAKKEGPYVYWGYFP